MRTALLTLVALATVATACSAPTSPTSSPPTSSPPTSSPLSAGDDASGAGGEASVRERSSGCDEGQGGFFWEGAGCQPATSIDLDDIVSGGPPPDGIPPIDEPVYEDVAAASEWLSDDSPVMVVDVDGDVRAYPLAILTWHEIVNDTVGGVPLVITYCPLCNSALVFERTIDGPEGSEVLDFGTSGRLYRSNLVMYDRQHQNLWTQFEGEAVVGESLLGTQLERVPAWLFGFGELSELHPEARVLARDTGVERDYGRNPYVSYDRADGEPFLFDGPTDDRFEPMERLVGLGDDADAVAVLLEVLADERVVEVEVDGTPHVVLWAPGQASALDSARIDEGRDVGQVAAFAATLDGEVVELSPGDRDDRFVDEATGSSFDLRGRGLDGPLAGEQLDAVTHDDTFWFVWVAFQPDTEVVAP
jgi:hypothetical protein